MFDTVEADGGFTYNAVGCTCVLKVSSAGAYSSLLTRLTAITEKDAAIAEDFGQLRQRADEYPVPSRNRGLQFPDTPCLGQDLLNW